MLCPDNWTTDNAYLDPKVPQTSFANNKKEALLSQHDDRDWKNDLLMGACACDPFPTPGMQYQC
jgi:hypothetical protein